MYATNFDGVMSGIPSGMSSHAWVMIELSTYNTVCSLFLLFSKRRLAEHPSEGVLNNANQPPDPAVCFV